MKPQVSYVVCTTPRSGSTLLCDTLGETGIAGSPKEFFVPGNRDEFLRAAQLGIRDHRHYVKEVIRVSTTPNGVFGTKIHAVQTPFILSKIGECEGRRFSSLRTALETAFPNLRYIFLVRKDKLAQAVSLYRATMTSEWWRYSEQVPERDHAVPFNQYAIKKALHMLESSDAYWERFFSGHGISPLRIAYEDLTSNYEGALRSTLQYLDLPDTIPIPPPLSKKIADERSKIWMQEFIEREKEDPILPTPLRNFGAPI